MGGLVKDYREIVYLDFPDIDVAFVKIDMERQKIDYLTNSEFEKYKERIGNPLP